MMPRDVATRWNSTFDMLDFAVDYEAAINAITGNRDMKMRVLELDAQEWVIATQLRDTLKVSSGLFFWTRSNISFQIFKHATLFFSRDTPNISTVIPAMDLINEHLATSAGGTAFTTSVRSALAIGKRTLNRYYDKTDYSEIYRIAMGKLNAVYLAFLTINYYCMSISSSPSP